MSCQQERQWSQDPEEFIQDEDEDLVGPRASGILQVVLSDLVFV